MSEEGKKAIKIVNAIVKVNKDFLNYETQSINKKEILAIETLLNLIEKQQKENKELKELLEEKTIRIGFENKDDYISKQVIRDKLKELEEAEKQPNGWESVYRYEIDLLKELLGE